MGAAFKSLSGFLLSVEDVGQLQYTCLCEHLQICLPPHVMSCRRIFVSCREDVFCLAHSALLMLIQIISMCTSASRTIWLACDWLQHSAPYRLHGAGILPIFQPPTFDYFRFQRLQRSPQTSRKGRRILFFGRVSLESIWVKLRRKRTAQRGRGMAWPISRSKAKTSIGMILPINRGNSPAYSAV